MAPRAKKTTEEIDKSQADAATISGITLAQKLARAKMIAFDMPDAKPKDILDALKLMCEIEGSEIHKEESIHIFLDTEYVDEYNKSRKTIDIPPIVITEKK